jgi:hypothetical protein
VYEFAANPENLPQWAPAFCRSVRREDNRWIAETTIGAIEIQFADQNALGVLDHWVKLASGEEFFNPMRVVPIDANSAVIFTLVQPPDMSDEKFAEDIDTVTRDLETLKGILEKSTTQ